MPGLININSASVVNGGSGGSNGTQTVTVVGGTVMTGGSPCQLSVTIAGGVMTGIVSVLNGGTYLLVPADPCQVSGAGLVGATVALNPNFSASAALDGDLFL